MSQSTDNFPIFAVILTPNVNRVDLCQGQDYPEIVRCSVQSQTGSLTWITSDGANDVKFDSPEMVNTTEVRGSFIYTLISVVDNTSLTSRAGVENVQPSDNNTILTCTNSSFLRSLTIVVKGLDNCTCIRMCCVIMCC